MTASLVTIVPGPTTTVRLHVPVPGLDPAAVVDDDAEAGVPRHQRLARCDHHARPCGVDRRAAAGGEVDPGMEVRVVRAAVGVWRLEHEAGRAPLLGDLERALRPAEAVARRRVRPRRRLSRPRSAAAVPPPRRRACLLRRASLASSIAASWAAAWRWSCAARSAAACAARSFSAIFGSTSSSAASDALSAASCSARFSSAATRSSASSASRAASSSRRALSAASSSRATARASARARRPSRSVARRVSSSARMARISSASARVLLRDGHQVADLGRGLVERIGRQQHLEQRGLAALVGGSRGAPPAAPRARSSSAVRRVMSSATACSSVIELGDLRLELDDVRLDLRRPARGPRRGGT